VLFGTFECIIILILGFLCRVIKVDENIYGYKYKHVFNTPLYGTIFNCCALILPVVVGNFFYKTLGGQFSLSFIVSNIGPLIVFCFAFIIVNSLIMSILMSIVTNKNVVFCFTGNIRMGILNSVVMIPIGILLALVFIKYGYLGIAFITFPLLLRTF